jgi:hypothetical protein
MSTTVTTPCPTCGLPSPVYPARTSAEGCTRAVPPFGPHDSPPDVARRTNLSTMGVIMLFYEIHCPTETHRTLVPEIPDYINIVAQQGAK